MLWRQNGSKCGKKMEASTPTVGASRAKRMVVGQPTELESAKQYVNNILDNTTKTPEETMGMLDVVFEKMKEKMLHTGGDAIKQHMNEWINQKMK